MCNYIGQFFKNTLKRVISTLLLVLTFGLNVQAQSVDDVRWKSESQVRELYGDPLSVQGPIGTHANYVLWKYADFTVAFANSRVFHVFKKDSLTKVVLQENRSK